MRTGVKSLLFFNRFFKCPEHPLNLQNEGTKSYSRWQYEMGEQTIALYLKASTKEQMFSEKTVLDVGCGAGGKTMYYAAAGVDKIVGMDVVEHYREDAESFAAQIGVGDRFRFVCGDAAAMPFADNCFDTIIMNDAMEHVSDREGVLSECYRVLKAQGRLYLNFPPFNHPYGAHLKDVIGIPWVHLFFSDKTMIEAYKLLVRELPDAQQRIALRIGADENGEEYFSYLNKISIVYFRKMLENSPFKVNYFKIEPIKRPLGFLSAIPFLNEFFSKMVVCILEK